MFRMAPSDRQEQVRWERVLLGLATAMLVAADASAYLTAHRGTDASGCSITHINVAAPVLLGCGGIFLVSALAIIFVAGHPHPGSARSRESLFRILWAFVIVAYAVSALAMYLAVRVTFCFGF